MLRIQKTGWKVVYIVAGMAALMTIGPLIHLTELPAPLRSAVSSLLFFAFVLIGARAFRGRDEPVLPARAWWRMTARPTAGFVLGGFFAVGVASSVVLSIVDPTGRGDALTSAIDILGTAPPAYLYLNCSIRLVRNPPSDAPTPLPVWKPIKR